MSCMMPSANDAGGSHSGERGRTVCRLGRAGVEVASLRERLLCYDASPEEGCHPHRTLRH
jgi:hypothetical protein